MTAARIGGHGTNSWHRNQAENVQMQVECEIRYLHQILIRRNRFNLCRCILDEMVDRCVDEVLLGERPDWIDSPLEEVWEIRWAASSAWAIAAESVEMQLAPYAAGYIQSAKWYAKPFVIVESAICQAAVRRLMADVARLYQELKARKFRHE